MGVSSLPAPRAAAKMTVYDPIFRFSIPVHPLRTRKRHYPINGIPQSLWHAKRGLSEISED